MPLPRKHFIITGKNATPKVQDMGHIRQKGLTKPARPRKDALISLESPPSHLAHSPVLSLPPGHASASSSLPPPLTLKTCGHFSSSVTLTPSPQGPEPHLFYMDLTFPPSHATSPRPSVRFNITFPGKSSLAEGGPSSVPKQPVLCMHSMDYG